MPIKPMLKPTTPVFRGMGTRTNPFQIERRSQLLVLRDSINSGSATYKTACFIQLVDLDLMGLNWLPIGISATNDFRGIYDGNGKLIKNISVSMSSGQYAGFFGVATNAIIRNLGIESGSISISGSTAFSGGLIGYSRGCKIDNCYNKATVTNTGSSGNCFAGGITGYNVTIAYTSIFRNCANYGAVRGNMTTTGSKLLGGIVGSGLALYIYCFNSGAITANEAATTRAIAGSNTIIDCYFDQLTSVAPQSNATGKDTNECTGNNAITTFQAFDFNEHWFVTNSYPKPSKLFSSTF